MALSFRQRILLVLIVLGTVPTAIALVGWALTLRARDPVAAGRGAIEQVGMSGRALVEALDTTRLKPAERAALARHVASLNSALTRVQQASTYTRIYSGALTLVLLGFGCVLIYASVRLGGHLSRQMSRPMEELIGWTGHIRRHESLPPDQAQRGAPEFAALRNALREMAANLELGRARELEAERLRAFQEVARRVAHEMKNPLTPIRFALVQLKRSGTPDQGEMLEVIAAESGRLEQMAREFTELGRLPEGPAAEVHLGELLDELTRTSLPETVSPRFNQIPGQLTIVGHYDPLRRAIGNILRNAVEAMNGTGMLDVVVSERDAGVEVVVADHGPGIPAERKARIFDPYFTSKSDGTGLGLTLVRQTVEAHGGSIRVSDTPGGGATFRLWLPLAGGETRRSTDARRTESTGPEARRTKGTA
ncbi:MAG TPA: HAMP domain-containing sensor histidine kinase [Gemmatimonadales bacterium]|jgi:signal transduction histidine kinase|nr:HAMP domain-containing sensor histidine kinase [Gemmatimonadales bacterium]